MSWASAFYEMALRHSKRIPPERRQAYWQDRLQDFRNIETGGLVPDAQTLKAIKKLIQDRE